MLKTAMHTLASSEYTNIPFLMDMILSVWDDTLWNSTAIRGNGIMSTLVRIPTGHMHFVPAKKQTDVPTADLSTAK
jgi:hypothetical protein